MLTFAYRIVLGLAFYLPLEDFLLKWLPVSDLFFLGLRQLPDILVLTALGAVLSDRLARQRRIRLVGRGAELSLFIFVGVAVVSAGFNDAAPLPAFLNLKALLRYILVVYVLLNIPLDEAKLRRALRVVLAAVTIQVMIGGLQAFFGPDLSRIFLPRVTDTSVGGLQLRFTAVWEIERGWVFGTMGQTVGFAGLLLVGLAAWLATRSQRTGPYWSGVLVLCALLYLSGSRLALMTGLLLVAVHQCLLGHASIKVVGGTAVAALALVAVALMRVDLGQVYLFEVFTERYFKTGLNQRFGVILIVLPQFLYTASVAHLLVGFSPDPAVLASILPEMRNPPTALLREIGIVEDVYFGALLLYYGVIGLLFFFYFVGRILIDVARVQLSSQKRRFPGQVATAALLLVIAAVPMNLMGRSFEIRQFAFYLWMIAGLALACRKSLRPTSPFPAASPESKHWLTPLQAVGKTAIACIGRTLPGTRVVP